MVVKKILGLASVSAAPLPVWYIRCWDNISAVLSRRLFGRNYIQHPDSAAWLSRKYWVWHLLVLPHCLSDAYIVGTTSLQYFWKDVLVHIIYNIWTVLHGCQEKRHLLVLHHCLSDASAVGTTSLHYFREDFLVDTIYNIRTVLHGCQENIGSGIC